MKWFAVSLSVILCHGFLVAQDRPNILMIAVDDLRPMLSCYGDERVQTPNFDRLAVSGMLFERAYCNYSKCGPSRMSLMTGLRPGTVGVGAVGVHLEARVEVPVVHVVGSDPQTLCHVEVRQKAHL